MKSYTHEELLNKVPIREWPWPRIVAAALPERAMSYMDDVFFPFVDIAQEGVPFFKLKHTRTDLARNEVAIKTLESTFTHVLMLDIDHKHPKKIVQMLARHVLADRSRLVVGGLNFRRGKPFNPCLFELDKRGKSYAIIDYPKGLINPNGGVGTGSILIAREVFERIEPPWFYYDYSRVWENVWPGEDMGFCKKCRESGIKMYCDTTVQSPHMINAWVNEEAMRQYLAAHPGEVEIIDEEQKP